MFYSRTERRWIARVSLGSRDGRRIRHKVRAATEAEAERKLAALLRSYRAGGEPATMTLDAYLAHWLDGYGPSVRRSTLTSYRGHVQHHISPLLGGILVTELRPSDVRRLIAERLRAGLSPATVGRIVTTLRIALGQAYRERAIADNPASVRLPRVEREPIRALTAEQAAVLLDALAKDPFAPLYRLLLGSGMRLGEALGLNWRDVQEGFVIVRKSKTQVRAVPISPDAAAALADQRTRTPRYGLDEPVFLGPRRGERLGASSALHAFQRSLKRAGLPRMRLHDLRHGTATLMLAQGVPMRVIAEQLGHKNPALTSRLYAHVVPESQRSAVDGLPRIGERNASR